MKIHQVTQQDTRLTLMFDLCRQVYPHLDGKFQCTDNHKVDHHWIEGSTEDVRVIQQLHNKLQENTPNAGRVYWMTRSWNLLCWQPIYISFIAIYALKVLPDFSQFKQQYQHSSITGFVFKNGTIRSGETDQLIALACAQLCPLFEHYRLQLDSFTRCRTSYVQRLLADLVLSSLIKVRDNIELFNDSDLLSHAKLWLTELGIPEHYYHPLIKNNGSPITHIRTSCCLTYKANNDLCANCPKIDKLNHLMSHTTKNK